jgi:purine-nucleoside phosphorylase
MTNEMLPMIRDAADFVRKRWPKTPEAGIILGTGLGDLSGEIKAEAVVPYQEIPYFPRPSVEWHKGELVLGTLSGRQVAALRGRIHYYEGYTMQQVSFPVRVLRALGAERLIVTSAVGGLNPLFSLGDIVAVTDHINLMGDNPLVGTNEDALGPRFPDMSEAYDRGLLALAEKVALDEKLPLRRGVFAAVAGPNLETRAEYRFLRAIGGDVVGMSLVPENLAAVHGGMKVLSFAVVTDMGLPDALEPVDIERILRVAGEATPKLTRLLTGVVKGM